jgi:hypothetical protein
MDERTTDGASKNGSKTGIPGIISEITQFATHLARADIEQRQGIDPVIRLKPEMEMI